MARMQSAGKRYVVYATIFSVDSRQTKHKIARTGTPPFIRYAPFYTPRCIKPVPRYSKTYHKMCPVKLSVFDWLEKENDTQYLGR